MKNVLASDQVDTELNNKAGQLIQGKIIIWKINQFFLLFMFVRLSVRNVMGGNVIFSATNLYRLLIFIVKDVYNSVHPSVCRTDVFLNYSLSFF